MIVWPRLFIAYGAFTGELPIRMVFLRRASCHLRLILVSLGQGLITPTISTHTLGTERIIQDSLDVTYETVRICVGYFHSGSSSYFRIKLLRIIIII